MSGAGQLGLGHEEAVDGSGKEQNTEMIDRFAAPLFTSSATFLQSVQPTRYSPVPCLGQLLMLSLQFAALLPTPFGNVEFVALKLVDALIEDTEKAFRYNNWCDLDSLGVIV